MWKRDEAVRPPQPTVQTPTATPVAPAAHVTEAPVTRTEPSRSIEKDMVNIGKSVVIKGELSGSEDLTIEGQVEGKIELRQNVLTIGPNGRIKAQVFAKTIVVQGEVHGNVTASERIDIRDNGSVDGDLSSPRVSIADGAHFRGSIDMQKQGSKPGVAHEVRPETKPVEHKPVEHKPVTTGSTPAATPNPVAAAPAR
jgi:cytoskeletal protein CcmA (bactofilin family)